MTVSPPRTLTAIVVIVTIGLLIPTIARSQGRAPDLVVSATFNGLTQPHVAGVVALDGVDSDATFADTVLSVDCSGFKGCGDAQVIWDLPDGSSVTAPQTTYRFTDPGAHLVTATVVGDFGAISSTLTVWATPRLADVDLAIDTSTRDTDDGGEDDSTGSSDPAAAVPVDREAREDRATLWVAAATGILRGCPASAALQVCPDSPMGASELAAALEGLFGLDMCAAVTEIVGDCDPRTWLTPDDLHDVLRTAGVDVDPLDLPTVEEGVEQIISYLATSEVADDTTGTDPLEDDADADPDDLDTSDDGSVTAAGGPLRPVLSGLGDPVGLSRAQVAGALVGALLGPDGSPFPTSILTVSTSGGQLTVAGDHPAVDVIDDDGLPVCSGPTSADEPLVCSTSGPVRVVATDATVAWTP